MNSNAGDLIAIGPVTFARPSRGWRLHDTLATETLSRWNKETDVNEMHRA